MPRLFIAIVALFFAQTLFLHGEVLDRVVASKHLGTNRTIYIYLPPSYDTATNSRYPVLYVQDGQNIFSTAGTNVGFGWGSWELDLTADRLIKEKKLRELIIVGIRNSPRWYLEYRGVCKAPGKTNDGTYVAYKKFVIEELKPEIDRSFRTLAGPQHTATLGASMGGVASFSLAWDHPEVFGQAASMAPAFHIEDRSIIEHFLKSYRGAPRTTRLYLDSGTTDFTGGDDGRSNTMAVVEQLRRIGWKDGTNLQHFVEEKTLTRDELEVVRLRKSKWAEAQISHHNEFYWRRRAWRPLLFLFPATP